MKHDYFTIKALTVDGDAVSTSNPMPVAITSGATNTTATNIVDSGGVAYTGSNPIPVTITSGATATSAVVIVDSTGVAYGGDNPLNVDGTVVVSSITATTAANIVDSTGVVYSGSNRLPTLNRPINVRGSLATAYISLSTGTETTLLAGVAATYHDLIYVMGTNNSDAAVSVDIRNVTAGNIQTTVRIPANGTAGVSLPVPIPQEETGNNWTADLPDITGTTVTLSALFSKES